MKIDLVCDTSALVAYGRRETGGDRVRDRLQTANCVMHAANVCELSFALPRRLPAAFTPQLTREWLERAGVVETNWFPPEFGDLVAEIRLEAPALSLGDGIALALASTLDVPVLTADRAFAQASAFARIDLIR